MRSWKENSLCPLIFLKTSDKYLKDNKLQRTFLCQVTVSVFFPIHTFQVFLLYQNVNAFLKKKKTHFNFYNEYLISSQDCRVLQSITLMTGTRGLNLEESWFSTSAKSCWCFKSFLIFMILTIAACTQEHKTTCRMKRKFDLNF